MSANLVLVVFVCLLIPMVFLLGVLNGHSRTIFGYMLIGMCVGLIAAQINTLIYNAIGEYFYVTTNLTPVCEEVLKGLPVLFFTFAVSNKTENVVPVAASVGIGFAVFENTTYLLQSASLKLLWVFGRGIGAGLMHATCTAALGFGISIVSRKKRLFLPGTFSLLSIAVIYHGVFNILVETDPWKYYGIGLPIVIYILLLFLLWHRLPQKS